MSKVTTRTYPIVTGAELKRLQSRIRNKTKKSIFKGFNVWLDVVELDELKKKPGQKHQFWDFFKKWTKRDYYHVTINYEKVD